MKYLLLLVMLFAIACRDGEDEPTPTPQVIVATTDQQEQLENCLDRSYDLRDRMVAKFDRPIPTDWTDNLVFDICYYEAYPERLR